MIKIREKNFISALQLFTALFICRLIIMLTINAQLAGGGCFIDNTVSALIACLLNFILIIPLWLLYRRRPTLDLLDESFYLLGKFGVVICLFYAVYFICVNWYYLSFFQLFIANVMDPKTPLWLVAAAVLVVACYGAFKGVEAIMRVSGFVLIMICSGLIFIIATLVPQMDPINFEPLLYQGPDHAAMGVVLFLSRSTGFAVMALLLPVTKGKKKLGFALWNILIYLFLTIMLVVMTGAVGDYLKTQLFPIYTASAIAEAGPFQRLDAVFLGMWMMGLFIKIALDLFLVSFCFTKIWNEKVGRVSIVAGALFIAVVAQITTNSEKLQAIFYGPWFLFSLTAATGLLIPLILLIVDLAKNGRRKPV